MTQRLHFVFFSGAEKAVPVPIWFINKQHINMYLQHVPIIKPAWMEDVVLQRFKINNKLGCQNALFF